MKTKFNAKPLNLTQKFVLATPKQARVALW